MYPQARTTELITEVLSSETIVYDTTNHRVHCLNETASLIWRHCDGQTSVEEMARQLSDTLGVPVKLDVVRLGLLDLQERHLLLEASPTTGDMSRRELSKRLAAVGSTLV